MPGGSSSGSAVAVARGIATFALGTDTAGSGRVPAALNGIVGLKPTLGALSATGMVPACRTLDTISIFAMTVADVWEVFDTAAGFDPHDAYSRKLPKPRFASPPPALRIGVPNPATLETFGDTVQADHFHSTLEKLRAIGATLVEMDFEPFYAVASMLYEGAWVAERVAAVGPRLTKAPDTLHPTTRAILEPGLKLTAVDAFQGTYRLKALARACEEQLAKIDALCVPTIPTFVTMAEIAADPVGPNSRLGTYTNFVNLLDMCGIAVRAGARADGRPGSVTFLAAAGRDGLCAALAASVEAGRLGATDWSRPPAPLFMADVGPDEIALAVCGAHMSGLPLNRELTSRGARFLRACRTAPVYGLHALAGGPPARPGLVRRSGGGDAIELEVWALPKERFGDFIAGVPAPLCIGTVALGDGTLVKGFLCESQGLSGSTDITGFGGWRAYLDTATRCRQRRPSPVPSNHLPVIDVSRLATGNAHDTAKVAAEIGAACRDIGFFYVAGHQVPPSLMEGVFAVSAAFFAQDEIAKRSVLYTASGNRGYVPMKGEALDPGPAGRPEGSLQHRPRTAARTIRNCSPARCSVRKTSGRRWPASATRCSPISPPATASAACCTAPSPPTSASRRTSSRTSSTGRWRCCACCTIRPRLRAPKQGNSAPASTPTMAASRCSRPTASAGWRCARAPASG